MAHIQITDLNPSASEFGDELTEEELLAINGGKGFVPADDWGHPYLDDPDFVFTLDRIMAFFNPETF